MELDPCSEVKAGIYEGRHEDGGEDLMCPRQQPSGLSVLYDLSISSSVKLLCFYYLVYLSLDQSYSILSDCLKNRWRRCQIAQCDSLRAR